MVKYTPIRPVADLDYEQRLDPSIQKLTGIPALYCMKTGRLWPLSSEPFDLLVVLQEQPQ